MTYEQVTYKPEGATRSRKVFLANVTEGPLTLSGVEVDRFGAQAGTLKVAKRIHVIDKTLVADRVSYQLNLHYGTLEPVT